LFFPPFDFLPSATTATSGHGFQWGTGSEECILEKQASGASDANGAVSVARDFDLMTSDMLTGRKSPSQGTCGQ
jgi:hypothetical protein